MRILMLNYEFQKSKDTNNLWVVSMIPGNLKEPLGILQKALKLRSLINNIQIPGMAIYGNAGLPINYFWRFV